MVFPELIESEAELEEVLSVPGSSLVTALTSIDGDLLILGAGGKMGPSLARLAMRASAAGGIRRKITCVSRFGDAGVRHSLESSGIATMSLDLLEPEAMERLPDAGLIVYLAGRKFGATGNQPLTWAINTFLPGLVMRRFRDSRIVIVSTGNVYPLTSVTSNGPDEEHPPGPIGEYAQSCLGRERITEYWSAVNGTRAAIVRLNYAIDLRYGVLLDIASKVLHRIPINLQMGHVNVIWQGDANTAILSLLGHVASPPLILNVTGEQVLSVRELALAFGAMFQVQPIFEHAEQETALLSDARMFHALIPFPKVPLSAMIRWTAHWLRIGGTTYDKPTHFQQREGKF